MTPNNEKNIVIKSASWKTIEKFITQGIQFIIQVVIARLITPNDFGKVAILLIFINTAQVLIQRGFDVALIQHKQVEESDFSSVFWFSLIVSIIVYIVLFLTAPVINRYFNNLGIVTLLRVFSIYLIISSLNYVQQSFAIRNMEFKNIFISGVVSIIVSGIAGIGAAYFGMGPWSLVIQTLVNLFINSLLLFFLLDWKPTLTISINRLRTFFSFGWKILVSSLINVFYAEIRTLIVGVKYDDHLLGVYDKGEQFPRIIATNIDGTIQTVLLSTMSQNQDNIAKVKELLKKSLMLSLYIVMPIMLLMIILAEPIIVVVLTDKWIESTIFLKIFSISYIFVLIQNINGQAITALGKTNLFLKLEIVKKLFGVIVLLVSIPFGIEYIALSIAVSSFVGSIITASANKKLFNYGVFRQYRDVGKIIIVSIISVIIIYPIQYFVNNNLLLLLIQPIFAMIIYFVLSYIFKLESFIFLKNTLSTYIKRKK